MKRILMLGGNVLQMTAIKRAKELGYYVISADYLPDNPGHKYSDEYHNISTIDKDAILALAEKKCVDGILSYASDISAPTAAYVSEKLGLPTNPYSSVMVLTHKDRFRAFMREQGFPMPEGKMFQEVEEAKAYFDKMRLPVIVKPTDSSGSKGVVKVTKREQFEAAYRTAMSYSISKCIIVEQFIEKKGYQIDGDGFIQDGKIVFWGVMDQHNHHACNPHAPIGLSYPSIQHPAYQEAARELVQSIFDRLDMRFGAFNFEYIIGPDGKIYLLEIGPRNGGNYIPDTLLYASGADLIGASIRACVGDAYSELLRQTQQKCASSYVVHAAASGTFRGLKLHEEVKDRIIKQAIFVSEGEKVRAFRNGGDSLGAMVLAFDDAGQMNTMMDKMWNYVEVLAE